jgi:hypothetical protein
MPSPHPVTMAQTMSQIAPQPRRFDGKSEAGQVSQGPAFAGFSLAAAGVQQGSESPRPSRAVAAKGPRPGAGLLPYAG